ncbi:MAG: 16S rRNA (uracil(1498)-N(3))-methyltransferase [Nitrincola lacisaponensis]|uniref:16S rRNA (uracil(1498)-N(3))-methyltransferase n=1 Tax=Nitrincola lacisaponensis TaxID=267850 RepID=UPI003919D141
MRVPRFFEDQPLAGLQQLTLSDKVAQHAGKVLRMREGDRLSLFNGDGCDYLAEITQLDKRQIQVQLLETQQTVRESPLQIEIGQALSRGERMDYAVQKATEMGCHRIAPLFTERCEVRLSSERQDKRQRHWQQVATSACEQSLRNCLPEILPPQTLEDWLNNCQADLKLVLHPHQAAALSGYQPPRSVALLIGPEGGLTDDEVALAKTKGFHPLSLGPRVMRTETAPVAACAVLHYLWGDLN